jgi:hypothetical protein
LDENLSRRDYGKQPDPDGRTVLLIHKAVLDAISRKTWDTSR